MGLKAKDVRVCVCRVTGFAMKTCYTFVRKHPLASGVTLTSFVLYLFLPSIFIFLLYASPIIIGIIVYGYFYVRTNCSAKQDSKKEKNSESKANDDVNKQNKPLMRSQLSVRRNARKNYKEWDDEGGGASQTDEMPKIFMEEEESLLNGFKIKSLCCTEENIDLVSSNQQPGESSGGGGGEVNLSRRGSNHSFVGKVDSSEGEDDDEDETSQEDRNKIVEWNDDDQKNLMDLGDSEIERNKRLESLIARRRARKLFKMQAEKILQHGENVPLSHVAPIFVARTNPSDTQNSFNGISGIGTPGSAPSVLFPSRNPFDLPYEPYEEKPNLMADSFQQEFTTAQQKEMFFSRHESFSHGPFFQLEPRRAWNDYRFGPFQDRPPQPMFRRRPNTGDVEQQTEISSQESGPIHDFVHVSEVAGQRNKIENVRNAVKFKHEENKNYINSLNEMEREQIGNALDMESRLGNRREVQVEINSVKYNMSEPSSPSSVESRQHMIYNQKKSGSSENLQRRRGVFPHVLANPVQNSFGCPIPTGLHVNESLFYSIPGGHNKSKMEERSFYTNNRRGCHTPTFSIASDMQVEPSEVSSPPAMIDEAPSSASDRESLTYDGDIEKGHSSGDEDMWTSFNTRSTVINDALETAITDKEFSSDNRKVEDPITSSLPSSQLITKQDLNNNDSCSKTEIFENVQPHSENIDNMTSTDAKLIMEEDGEPKPFSFPDSLSLTDTEKKMKLLGESLGLSSWEVNFQNPEDISHPPTKPEEQAMVIEYVDDPVVHASDDVEDPSLLEKRENSSMIPIKQEEEATTSETAEEIDSNYGQPSQNETILLFNNQINESKFFKLIEEPPISENSKEKKVTEEPSRQDEAEGNVRSLQDTLHDQNVVEVGISGVSEGYNELGETSLQPEQVDEQVSSSSSSSSSPTSVLELERHQTDHTSLPNFDHQIHIDFPQSGAEDIVNDNLLDEQTLQNLSLPLHQGIQNTEHDHFDHQANNSIAGTSEEPCHALGKSIETSSMVNNSSEHVFDEKSTEGGFSINTNDDKISENLTGKEPVVNTSKNAEENNPKFNESRNIEDLAVPEPINRSSNAEDTSKNAEENNLTSNESRNIEDLAVSEPINGSSNAEDTSKNVEENNLKSNESRNVEDLAVHKPIIGSSNTEDTSKNAEENNPKSNESRNVEDLAVPIHSIRSSNSEDASKNAEENNPKANEIRNVEDLAVPKPIIGSSNADDRSKNAEENNPKSNESRNVEDLAVPKPIIGSSNTEDTSKNAEENNPKSNEIRYVEDLTGPGPVIGSSNTEETTRSDVLETTGKDEGSRHRHGEVNEEANVMNDPIVDEKQVERRPKSIQDSEEETEISIGHDTSLEPIKLSEVAASHEPLKENQSSSANINHEPSGKVDGNQDITHLPTSADDRSNSEGIINTKTESERS